MYCKKHAWFRRGALFSTKRPTLIQKRHPYTGTLNSEMHGDSKNEFQHGGHDLRTPPALLASVVAV